MQYYYTVFDMSQNGYLQIGLGPQNPKNFIYEAGGFPDETDDDKKGKGAGLLIFFLIFISGFSICIYCYMKKRQENPTFKKLSIKNEQPVKEDVAVDLDTDNSESLVKSNV